MKRFILMMLVGLFMIGCAAAPSSQEKKSKSPFPDGVELITLVSATISPDVITTDGSDIEISFTNNDSIPTDNLIPVVVIIANTMTITQRTLSESGSMIEEVDHFSVNVSNPQSYDARTHSFGKGKLSGGGTIYIYLEKESDNAIEDDKTRVSNIISVFATFE